MRFSFLYGLLALGIPFVAAESEHAPHWGRRHHQVARRARGELDLSKRQSYANARFTFYDVGLGACGQTSAPSDFIVALNVGQYGGGYPGPFCFQTITIMYGGKTAQATIMDECMGCPWGGLDFSRGLFDYFASESEGVIYGTWWFGGGGGEGGGGSTPTTSSAPQWTPTTSYAPPATTSTSSSYLVWSPSSSPTSPTTTSSSTSTVLTTPTSSATSTHTTTTTSSNSGTGSLSPSMTHSGSDTLVLPTSVPGASSTGTASLIGDLYDSVIAVGEVILAFKEC